MPTLSEVMSSSVLSASISLAAPGVEGAAYDVFDAEGAFLGTVRAPENVRLQAALGDTVFGFAAGTGTLRWRDRICDPFAEPEHLGVAAGPLLLNLGQRHPIFIPPVFHGGDDLLTLGADIALDNAMHIVV